jgi:hypothetical protein
VHGAADARLMRQTAAKSQTSEDRVAWAGHNFREVTALGGLPIGIRTLLGVGKPRLDGIADPGGKYNSTDVVDSRFPRRRFLVAGVSKDAALVAVECCGFSWNVEVALYSNTARKPSVRQTWTLFESPRTLRALVDHLRATQK